MKVVINRDVCPAHLAFCERCLGKFLREPLGYERRCLETLEDDGSKLLTVELHSGEEEITLQLNEEERQLMAAEGWSFFVDFDVPQYRDANS